MARRPIVDPRFAAQLRGLREQRGLSLRGLARLANHGKTYIHELETGQKTPTATVARRLDDKLRANGELAAMVVEDTAAPVPRRQFIGAAAGLAAQLSTTPTTRSGRRRIALSDVVQIVRRTARLRRLDNFLGGVDTYATYAAEVDVTAGLLREATYGDHTRTALLSTLGEQAQLVGWAAFDAGWQERAVTLFTDSLTAAEEAGDVGLAGNALVLLAYQRLSTGGSGVELATAATDTARDGATPRVRALLHERRAWAHAVAGQRAETEAALDLAEGALAQHDDRPEPDWVFWVDHIELAVMTGRCWAVLHRPLRAISKLENILNTFADTHARDKALYLSYLADAYLDANEPEQAATTVGRVMDLSASVGSVRPYQRVDQILPRLRPYRALPAVAEVLTAERRSGVSAIPQALPTTVAPSQHIQATRPPVEPH